MTGAVVTAWSAISACGVGRAALRAGQARPTRVDGGPGDEAFLAADFVVDEALGTKGTGSMDRSSALGIGVVGDVLAGLAVDERTGVVLGTTSGSAQTQLEFTRDSLTRRKPYFVNPATMPFALMNSAAAQAAIWHKLTGPNSTIAGGRLSGLGVLRYGTRLLAAGRASGVVCGAVEEYSAARAWLEEHRGRRGSLLGEGAAAVFVEPAGSPRPVLAEVLGIETRVAVDGDPEAALASGVRRVLERAAIEAGDVTTVALSAPGGLLGEAERAVADAAFSGLTAVVDPAEAVGDVGAAIGMFQVVAVLDRPGFALVTALDDDGTVGCGLLRVPDVS
ncbi:beta-ketoacyl synthase N-terminal-like domain-containing protein [Prauserella muralis]|uniref:3-oxoacyl-ACP synthase n=1 Tax=Prauserella muralis TaxID=588067 RepID=A0A2V4BAQ3_9PSEU|nr:beta-ketoacyl synthase N-terminal-like domain-containing protein [Prauserella muralis]PXY32226.1 3-oxoacyl-ACP synthase [Prauserella muralis]TWE24111.1 3-oxoacyl-[acyl-carrier-protein] synthase II [Prauserella muralis]